MKILLISFFNPFELNSGSSLRSNCLLKNLTELGYTVHLLTLSQSDYYGKLKDYPNISKARFLKRTQKLGFIVWLKSILLFKPLAISQYISNNITQSFTQFIHGETYDVTIFDHLCAFEFRKYLHQAAGRIIIYEHNAEFIMAREFYQNRDPLDQKLILLMDSFLVRRYEFRALSAADRVVHVSEHDLRSFSPGIQEKSVVIPNTLPYKTEFGMKMPPINNVVFVGAMVHYANVEGILRFIREVWMEIHDVRRDINLLIVGAKPPREIQNYHGRYNINVLGFVDDLSDIYEKSSIAIAPIYIGSGSRLKVLEAMMHNTLNVISTKGAEGLPVEDGKHVVIAADNRAWINAILDYIDNKDERMKIEKNAHEFVVNNYYYNNYQPIIKNCIQC